MSSNHREEFKINKKKEKNREKMRKNGTYFNIMCAYLKVIEVV